MSTFAEQQQAVQQDSEQFAEPLDLIGDIGFLDAFPPPQTLTLLSGKKVVVKPWSTDDYLPWLAELTAKLQSDRMAVISAIPNAKPEERFRMVTNTKETEMTPDDMMGLMLRPANTKKVVVGALMKAKVPESEALEYFASRPAKANEMLGLVLSGLYTTTQINNVYRRFMPDTVTLPRTFGQNGGTTTGPFVNRSGDLIPVPSGDKSGEDSTGQLPDSESSKQPGEAQVA